MKYRAVIFDLFGTLVRNFTTPEYQKVLQHMAETTGLPPSEFIKQWWAAARQRNTGDIESIKSFIKDIGSSLGKIVQEEQAEQAVKVRLDYVREMLTPRPQAIDVLTSLRSRGYKTGLVSDCSVEIPMVFDETPLALLFDTRIFSCSVGVRKPDPRIYQLACEDLKVPPQKCLYIGDGGSHELTGATQSGMQAVMIEPYGSAELPQANSEALEWQGPKIKSLSQVLDLVDA